MTRSILFSLVAAIALSAPAFTRPAAAQQTKLLNVSYDPTRELYEQFNQSFADYYKSQTGKTLTVTQSHGGSGKQARAVIDGLQADVVTLALAWDVTAIEDAGLISPGWQDHFPDHSSPYTSTIVFLVRKGNPKGIHDWADLIKPDVQVIAPNPKTSGGARWNFLAAWGWAANAPAFDLSTAEGKQKSDQQAAEAAKQKTFSVYENDSARKFVTQLYKHVPVLDTGARGATVTFAQKGIGDVLVGWENEAWLASDEFGKDKFEIVYPGVSVLAEPPVAVVDKVVDAHGTRDVATAYLKYLYSPEAQEIIGQNHYRPRDTKILAKYRQELPPLKLFTINGTFQDWTRAQKTFFANNGVFDQIYQPTAK
ncbi:MAG: sulfate transporter substrate-binding protein [Phycisphaerales bacterium]|nr:sulfate transporter substrate-binding protein [Phycisphaerales bacterium]